MFTTTKILTEFSHSISVSIIYMFAKCHFYTRNGVIFYPFIVNPICFFMKNVF